MAASRPRRPRLEWPQRFRKRRVDPFTGATPERLGLLRPPEFDMSDTIREELQAEVDAWIARLLPRGVDAYTGDVLDAWIDARGAQLTARLFAEYDERQALGDALVGLAREDVVRHKARYDADAARLQQAVEALEVARTELTGRPERGPIAARPVAPDEGPIGSTLGSIDITSGIDITAGMGDHVSAPGPRYGLAALHHLKRRTTDVATQEDGAHAQVRHTNINLPREDEARGSAGTG